MKKIMFMALAVMSVLIMGCAPAVGGDVTSSKEPVVINGDQNGATVTVSETGTILRNVTNASLVIDSNVKSLVFEDSKLTKVTVNSNAELSFVNTQIEEFESNGNVVIKEGKASGGGRSARAANADKQAEKAGVVINKVVMKGNVQAAIGLYKKIEKPEGNNSEFEFPKDSTARVEDFGVLTLNPVYEGFDGVKVDIPNRPAIIAEKFIMDVYLKKGDVYNQIFYGHNKSYGSNTHTKSIVEAKHFYWPFLESNKDYELTITYKRENDNGIGSVLLSAKTIKVTPERGRGDVKVFLDENKGTVKFNENGDIVWTKKPQIGVNEIANVSYELFSKDQTGELVWHTQRNIKTDCEGGPFDGFNIYKDGFFPALDDRGNNIYNNKVFLILNYNLDSSDNINDVEYKYGIHTQVSAFSNEITYDKSKYEIAFDAELDRTNNSIKITKMPSAKTKALWKSAGGTKVWFNVKQGDFEKGADMIEIDSIEENATISLGEVNLPEGTLSLEAHLFNNDWVEWIFNKTIN